MIHLALELTHVLCVLNRPIVNLVLMKDACGAKLHTSASLLDQHVMKEAKTARTFARFFLTANLAWLNRDVVGANLKQVIMSAKT
mmetsp:Transcript_25395/g.35606  ORF Transcript_25395/g.35606 Transcript_25395/m.35606 type:complete len:85 (+) Transcript_25395:737-991(+)